MLVTVFSDASRDHEKKVAGWGGWAKSERGVVYHGGAMKIQPPCIETAEMMACVNTLWLARSHGIFQYGDSLLIQLDSQQAIMILRGQNRKPKYRPYKRGMGCGVVQRFDEIVKGSDVQFRHVRAHQKNDEPRNYINNLCDKLARKGLKEAREAL